MAGLKKFAKFLSDAPDMPKDDKKKAKKGKKKLPFGKKPPKKGE